MKRFLIFMVLMSFFSCDYFDKKKVHTEDLLEEELKTFNWKDVDQYPSFATCDTTSAKENRKLCFENTLRSILNASLASHLIVASEAIQDTVYLKITIDNKGRFSIDDIKKSQRTLEVIPELDSLLRTSLDSLPKIYPAIKRSQEVATQFTLPVLVKIE